ncbi:MAG TPA: transcriptional repressor [bacterium]|jgi:Fur family ferric uptake transcriptional regulator|nr:transcriptional repressor [bacterium]
MIKAAVKNKRAEYEVFSLYLKEKDLKLTAQRELILETFLSHQGHISAEELFQKAREKQSHVGFATVYRTLKHMTQCGLARELDFGDGRIKYEPEYNHQHHDHMICTKCGTYIEFLNPQIEELQEQVSRKHGFKITSHRMQLYGLCQKCQKIGK